MYYVFLLKEVRSTLRSKEEMPICFEFYSLFQSSEFDESLCEMWQYLSWGWGAIMGKSPDPNFKIDKRSDFLHLETASPFGTFHFENNN